MFGSRTRRRLASLVSACLALGAVGGLGASGAAALGEQCSGSNIDGKGGFLQGSAQATWSTGEAGFNASSGPLGCGGSQGSGGKPKASFTTVGSGNAMHGWGVDDGVFHDESTEFLGTEEPPGGPVAEAGTDLARIKEAIGSDLVVAPLTQTAIAIVANPPFLPAHAACKVGFVTAEDLEGVFSGRLLNWRQLSAASDPEPGGDCDQAITRVAPGYVSGTTYQFKHYLDQVEAEPLECTGESPRTWKQLQPGREPQQLNRVWPRKADCQEGEGPVTVVATPESPLSYIKANRGTVGFGSLPQAQVASPALVVPVHNGTQVASPIVGKEANCSAAEYTLPSGWAAGVNVDWSLVYGSDPTIEEEEEEEGKGAYPICTLSWAVAAADSGGVFGTKAGTTVRDYLHFGLGAEAGQAALSGSYYAPLPGPVAEAAAVALGEIGGEGEGEEEGGEEGEPGAARLCSVAPEVEEGTLDCPVGKGYAGEVTGKLLKFTQLKSVGLPGGTITCNEARLQGKFEEDGTSSPEGGIVTLGFGSSGGACTSSLSGSPKLFVKLSKGPFEGSKFVYLAPLAPQASFVLAKAKGTGVPELLVVGAEELPKCQYQASFLSGQVVNGNPTALTTAASWDLLEGSETCPVELTQTAELSLMQEGGEANLYVAGE